jgi:serine/threonine-protein kinase
VAKDSGKTLGNYVVEEEIAKGGMGVVMRARQPSLEREVILKKIRRDLTEQPELADRFEREARAAAAIHHHNVVAVYDCFRHRNDQNIAQAFIDGVNLSSVLERKGALPWRTAAIITLEALRGLEEIHAGGTVHRDIKPSNILLGRRGEVKIADFGIALDVSSSSLTIPGMMIGTPPYMPPEQMMGERMDARGDLFSLGILLYLMLAGELPYGPSQDGEDETLLRRMQKERYVPVTHVANVPRLLARIVRDCLRAKPGRRPSGAREVRQSLDRHLGYLPSADGRAELCRWLWDEKIFEARGDETVYRGAPPPPRAAGVMWRLVIGALVLGLALGASILFGFVPREHIARIPAVIQELTTSSENADGE